MYFFYYKDTEIIKGHTVIGVLENYTSICQAIVSVTVLVFLYLGYSIWCISGEVPMIMKMV